MSSRCPHNMVNFGPVAAEIGPVVWGTPANFNGVHVLAVLLHDCQVVGVSQTLWRWTEGITYVLQGDHHVGHWPTFQLSQGFSSHSTHNRSFRRRSFQPISRCWTEKLNVTRQKQTTQEQLEAKDVLPNTNPSQADERAENAVFVPGDLDVWPWPSNVSERGTKYVLCVKFGANTFSDSRDISYTNKNTDWRRQKQNLPQFTAVTACGKKSLSWTRKTRKMLDLNKPQKQTLNLNQHSSLRTVHVLVCIIVHRSTRNSFDNCPSYPTDNHHS